MWTEYGVLLLGSVFACLAWLFRTLVMDEIQALKISDKKAREQILELKEEIAELSHRLDTERLSADARLLNLQKEFAEVDKRSIVAFMTGRRCGAAVRVMDRAMEKLLEGYTSGLKRGNVPSDSTYAFLGYSSEDYHNLDQLDF